MSDERPFELRAGMQLMPSLLLRDPDPERIRRALAEVAAQAPAMFCGGALVALDLEPLRASDGVPDFGALAEAMREAGMIPAGVRNAGPGQQEAARAAGWALLPDRREAGERKEPAPPPTPTPEAVHAPARVVSQPVRSGQQVYAAADLVLLAQVSAGAEVLADGCIHVYGPLRGRALAGVQGDATARIFCRALHAELISVAGRYRTLDDLEPELRGKPAQIRLEGEQLIIEPM